MPAPESLPPHAAEAPYVLEDQVGHLLRRAHQRATQVFLEGIGQPPLTPTQFAALIKVGDLGEVSQNHLGRLTAMDPATSQGVIRRLVAAGLVERRASATDRRRAMLRLTAPGEAAAARGRTVGKAISAATLAPLTTGEQVVFLALLKRLI